MYQHTTIFQYQTRSLININFIKFSWNQLLFRCLLAHKSKRKREITSERVLINTVKVNSEGVIAPLWDGRLIHWYTPETVSTVPQLKRHTPGKWSPKKEKSIKSAGKAMVNVFWDSQGVFNIDYLKKSKTQANGLYYAELLGRIAKKVHQVKWFFHRENAPARDSAFTTFKLVVMGHKHLPDFLSSRFGPLLLPISLQS